MKYEIDSYGPFGLKTTIVDTDQSIQQWKESITWNGNNMVSKATGSQWDHETMYRSKRGRYYIERTTQWQGRPNYAYWLSEQEACAWLIINEHLVPDDLLQFVDQIME
jgi:hypothetical protein